MSLGYENFFPKNLFFWNLTHENFFPNNLFLKNFSIKILSARTGQKLKYKQFFENFTLVTSKHKIEQVPSADGARQKRTWDRV